MARNVFLFHGRKPVVVVRTRLVPATEAELATEHLERSSEPEARRLRIGRGCRAAPGRTSILRDGEMAMRRSSVALSRRLVVSCLKRRATEGDGGSVRLQQKEGELLLSARRAFNSLNKIITVLKQGKESRRLWHRKKAAVNWPRMGTAHSKDGMGNRLYFDDAEIEGSKNWPPSQQSGPASGLASVRKKTSGKRV
jgi:hypothetical protein